MIQRPTVPSELAKLMLEQPEHPLVRQQKCYDAILQSLNEYHCQLAVSVKFIAGASYPEITIVAEPESKAKIA